MKTILFTGGGTAGHVIPNLALIDKFALEGWQLIYLGSATGIEKELVAKKKVTYFAIPVGKLRRYFSWQNLIDPLKISLGIIQAWRLCRALKPNVVFSKGGFVAFPVVVGAWLNRIPVVVHESDFSPGLANRLSFPFASAVCVTFAEAKQFFRYKKKVVVTGTPIREALLQGCAQKGKEICRFTGNKPTILALGGGQGAAIINQTLRILVPTITDQFNIIHLCGKNKIEPALNKIDNYKQFEFVEEELPDLMAAADIVISRAGANSLYELLALKKPHILVPLSRKISRGDQLDNANYFAKLGLSSVIEEDDLTAEKLFKLIEEVYRNQAAIQQKLYAYEVKSATQTIFELLNAMKLEHKFDS